MKYEIVIDFIDKRGNSKTLKIVVHKTTSKGEIVRDERFWVTFLEQILGYEVTLHTTKKVDETVEEEN